MFLILSLLFIIDYIHVSIMSLCFQTGIKSRALFASNPLVYNSLADFVHVNSTKFIRKKPHKYDFQPPSVEYLQNAIIYGVGVAACMENMMYKMERTIEVEKTVNAEDTSHLWAALEKVDVSIVEELMDIIMGQEAKTTSCLIIPLYKYFIDLYVNMTADIFSIYRTRNEQVHNLFNVLGRRFNGVKNKKEPELPHLREVMEEHLLIVHPQICRVVGAVLEGRGREEVLWKK